MYHALWSVDRTSGRHGVDLGALLLSGPRDLLSSHDVHDEERHGWQIEKPQ